MKFPQSIHNKKILIISFLITAVIIVFLVTGLKDRYCLLKGAEVSTMPSTLFKATDEEQEEFGLSEVASSFRKEQQCRKNFNYFLALKELF